MLNQSCKNSLISVSEQFKDIKYLAGFCLAAELFLAFFSSKNHHSTDAIAKISWHMQILVYFVLSFYPLLAAMWQKTEMKHLSSGIINTDVRSSELRGSGQVYPVFAAPGEKA